jgi:hypothetical protein
MTAASHNSILLASCVDLMRDVSAHTQESTIRLNKSQKEK